MLTGGRGIDGLDRLDVRLVALLGLALLPIGLIAMVQTYRVISEADRNAEAALTGATLAAATEERESILRVRGAAQMASRMMPLLVRDPEACSDLMSGYANSVPNVAFAGYVDMDGLVACASDGMGADVSDSDVYRAFLDDPSPSIEAVVGQISDRSVIVVTEPVRSEGEPMGYVALSIPQASLVLPPSDTVGLSPLLTMTFTANGQVLWSPDALGDLESNLPAEMELGALAADKATTTRARSAAGPSRIYTTAPLVPGEVFAMAVWPDNAIRTTGLTAASAILFPLLMWMVTIGVAYFSVHRLVVRHIRYLRLRIRAFTANRRIMSPMYGADTPSDLREVIDAFHHMTERIVRDEADLENNLHEKDVLLKEVHHRVKNNLQLIASMTNMQLRKAESPETRFVLKRLQDRVQGLATIHRNLYQASVLSRVESGEMIEELVNQCVQNSEAEEAGVEIRVDVDNVLLYPDQAVPLSLLVTETITNALKYVGDPEDGHPWIELTLRMAESGKVQLNVTNSIGRPLSEDATNSSGLGTQLMSAFAMQLDAQSEIGERDGVYAVRVEFLPSDFGPEA